MHLHGTLQGHKVPILINSSSTHTFLSQKLASEMEGLESLKQKLQVQVANGQMLQCTSGITQAVGSLASYTFVSDMKILPLQHFDIILGMDWLETFSLMKVHWKHKWMAIPYHCSTAFVQGIVPVVPDELQVHICSVVESSVPSSNALHPSFSVVLDEFAIVLEPMSALPPERNCEHIIPLVPGVGIWVAETKYSTA